MCAARCCVRPLPAQHSELYISATSASRRARATPSQLATRARPPSGVRRGAGSCRRRYAVGARERSVSAGKRRARLSLLPHSAPGPACACAERPRAAAVRAPAAPHAHRVAQRLRYAARRLTHNPRSRLQARFCPRARLAGPLRCQATTGARCSTTPPKTRRQRCVPSKRGPCRMFSDTRALLGAHRSRRTENPLLYAWS